MKIRSATSLGMSDWLRRSRAERGGRRTVVVGLHRLAGEELRFARRHGALVPLRADATLIQLCRGVVEDGIAGSDLVIHDPVDGALAGARRLPAITLTSTGSDEGAGALGRALAFCGELIERIDGELGPRIARSQAPRAAPTRRTSRR